MKKRVLLLGLLCLVGALLALPAAAQTIPGPMYELAQAGAEPPAALAPHQYAAEPEPGVPLATPTNVRWHVNYDGAYLPGAVAWDTVLDADRYFCRLSLDGELLREQNYKVSFGLIPSFPAYAFIQQSGRYTFEVRAVSAGGAYADSGTATAEFFYTRPAQALGQATNLHWEGSRAVFTAPVANGYKVNLYRIENGTQILANAYWIARPGLTVAGSIAQEVKDSFSWLPDGRYCFTVQMLSADILQTANGAESAPSGTVLVRDGKVLDNENINAFVTRLYRVCLEREPDDGGLADWAERLQTGQVDGANAVYGFVFSKEFTSKNYCSSCFLNYLYQAFFGHDPDAAGKQDWLNRMANGMWREDVLEGFAGSTEFGQLCASYGIVSIKGGVKMGSIVPHGQYGTIPRGACSVCGEKDGVTQFVERLYRVCFDREADAGGLADWTGQLWDHVSSGTVVAHGFAMSEEMANLGFNDEQYVEAMYRAFFDRQYDDAGKADWLNRMHAQGYDREQVFYGFAGSQEFDDLCKRYGITRE